ncbi:MAG: hypothetical protein A3B38_02030 [Candidatus Levybacteria bacterium RIFCSPLOWO2_01_FULL_36_13]|nr:MAG: hypothetical protein A2684_03265 [Candidatus Levybacteria bacterium RIFCSPHIGHO2_01_FULL_36_15b]OGH35641.1 MAG: hypothetical protein A3B38_02030 [Candidatus Levybacteria bacterium RIFCSPLOWO2_01_FULL_36_13]
MEKIAYKNNLIALRLKKIKNGVMSFTEPSEPIQLVTHKRSLGEYTKAHLHSPKKRTTNKLQECLVLIKGKIKIDLYNSEKKYFKSIFISAGEAVIFVSGGHGVHILEDSEIIEIKNGPFIEDKVLI